MFISTVVTPSDRARFTRNVLRVYGSVSDAERRQGETWYSEAHRLASSLDANVRRSSGVIAALSANKSWRDNVALTFAAYRGDPIGHTGATVSKAMRIMQGETPESVLPMHLKTGNFYTCILWPDHPMAVCIDRHGHDIAYGEACGEANRGLGNAYRYSILADAYRSAARIAHIPAPTMQAITWCAWRKRLLGTVGRTYTADRTEAQ